MDAHGIEFEFQVPIELIPAHKINNEKVYRATVRVDFVIKVDDKIIYMDTKGYPTPLSRFKYKLLGWVKTQEEANFEIVWLKTKTAVLEFVNKLKKEDE